MKSLAFIFRYHNQKFRQTINAAPFRLMTPDNTKTKQDLCLKKFTFSIALAFHLKYK